MTGFEGTYIVLNRLKRSSCLLILHVRVVNVRVLFEAVPATHHHAITSRVVLGLCLISLIKEHIIPALVVPVLLGLIQVLLLRGILIKGAHVSTSELRHQAIVIYKAVMSG